MELVFKCIVPILKIITRCKVTTMANYKDLCRLCATNTDFFKNVFDENNKNILKMIQDFIQISITESDDLPKNICLNCEEKMVTFQLFVLECYKAQEILKLFKNKTDVEVKYEQCSDNESIKSEGKLLEVKNEMINEDLAQVMNNQELSETLSSSYLMYDVDNDNFAEDFDDEKEDNEEDLSLALLKEIKTKKIKDKADSFINIETLQIIIQKPNFKARDIISFDCVICNEKLKSWNTVQYHYIEVHKSRPFVICMCGQDIKSQNKLYKHVADHKLEGKKLREQADNDSTLEEEMNVKVKDFVRFTCHECETECSSWYKLSAHCRTIHQTAAIVKCTCGIVLRSKTVMYRHIHEHKTPNTLACDKCPRITNSIAALNKHKQRHVPKSDRKYCCSSCDKIFTTKDAVRSHEKSHIPIEDRKIYCCDVCSLKFTTRSSAMSHKRVVHDKIKSYVCDLCGYACGTNGELTQHRAIHSADKPFVCKKCSKPFKTYSNLKTHMDTHEDTAYECYVCRRILNSRRTLRKHLLVHEDKFRHTCSYCNKGFKRRQTLKVHMYTHTGDKPLSCKWCSERFSYASTLRSHRLRCHADKLAPPNDYTLSYDQHAAANTNFIKQVSIIPGSMSVSKNEVEAI